jgi:hypothetical protein
MKNLLKLTARSAVPALAFLLFTSGCAQLFAVQPQPKESKELDRSISQTLPKRAPALVELPIKKQLREFGHELRAYTWDNNEILVNVEYVANESTKELYNELGFAPVQVLTDIGPPFRVERSVLPDPRPQYSQKEPPKVPTPVFRVRGVLIAAQQQIELLRNWTAAGQAGGGHTQGDTEAKRDIGGKITDLRLQLSLVSADDRFLDTTTTEIFLERSEKGGSFSFFVGGTGIGGGKKTVVTEKLADGLYQITALAMMKLLGTAMQIPYYRIGNGLYPHDEALDSTVRNFFATITRKDLEFNIKRFMWAEGGYNMNMSSADMTDLEKAVTTIEMRNRGLNFADRDSLTEFAVQLWQHLNIDAAARRISDALTLNARAASEAQAEQERLRQLAKAEEARKALKPLPVSPQFFGWQGVAAQDIFVLDLTRLRPQDRKLVLDLLAGCETCGSIRYSQETAQAAVLDASRMAAVHSALRTASLHLRLNWGAVADQRRLLVAPL